MAHWQQHSLTERLAMLNAVSRDRHLSPTAVEKDWWVTMVLKALSMTKTAHLLNFKGGTSLSKGFGLIDRFSEDIDLSIRREEYFAISSTVKSQRERLRKKSRSYIQEALKPEIEQALSQLGVRDYNVRNVTEVETKDGLKPIDSDKDPTVIMVDYKSIIPNSSNYVSPWIKIEISCLSMAEPTEEVELQSFISQAFPDDDDSNVSFRTVLPTRTFLEKAFLLCEEFQKEHPRSMRMSRHLYDLEKLMDTEFGVQALEDKQLYDDIIEHRRTFYALRYVDYDKLKRNTIDFLPPLAVLNEWKNDYEQMTHDFIYGDHLSFEDLLKRIELLRERFRVQSMGQQRNPAG